MATFKRVDGDYNIVSINPTDVVNLDTSQVIVTGNVVANGIVANIVTSGFFIGNGGGLSNISASFAYANVLKYTPMANSRISTPTDSGNILVDVNGVANVALFTAQGIYSNFTGNFEGPLIGDVTGVVTGDLLGSVLKEDSTVLVDANTETHYGTFVGNIAGNTTFTGNISSPSSLEIATGGDIVLAPTGNVLMSSGTIGNVPNPVLSTDVASKQYVDTMVSTGIIVNTPVRLRSNISVGATYAFGGTTHTVTTVATGNTLVMSAAHSLAVNDVLWFTNSFNGITGNLAYLVYSIPAADSVTLSSQYNGTQITGLTNGTGLSQPVRANPGVGAALTNNGTLEPLTVDGVTANLNDRILLPVQGNPSRNGVYVVTNTGNASVPWVLTRSTDTNTYIPDSTNGLDVGDYFYVQSGDTGAGSSYVMAAPVGPFIIGYSNLTFTQFSSSLVYSAGTGLDLNGTTFSVNAVQSLTSVSTSGNVTATGNVTGGNLITGGLVVATGNVTGGNITTTGLISATGNVSAGNINVTSNIVATGATSIITGSSGNVSLAPNGTNTLVATTTGVVLTGTLTFASGGNVSAGNIINTNSNGVGNIGSSTTYFNTVFAKATSAQYADIAEMYVADAYYEPGTVLSFGGANEVTRSTQASDAKVAGVVSQNPSYLMNSTQAGEHVVALALVGRVPTMVQGPVAKGDMMVSAGNGMAMSCSSPSMGTVIGKALEDFSGAQGKIEMVVGRL